MVMYFNVGKTDNEQFAAVVNYLKLTYDQARRLHDEVAKAGYGYQEMLQIARDMFGK